MSQPSDPPGSAAGPPPGWYADPSAPPGRSGRRWWDGASWTEHVVADPVGGPMGGPMGGAVAGAPTTPDGQPLAGWGRRLAAYLLDLLVLVVPVLVLTFPFLREMAHQYRVFFDQSLDASVNGTAPPGQSALLSRIYPATLGYSAVTLVVVLAYNAVMLKTRSATVGKLALGLRVRLREAPGPLSWSTIGRRLLAQFAAVFLGGAVPVVGSLIGLYSLLDGLWPLWDAKRQSLHDKVARTNVVRVTP